ncbi:MAG: hypothetical protein ACREF4_04785 [Gammaproteobacteria bacterium]
MMMDERARRLFYPTTCHPALTRRQLLVGAGALLAAPLVHGRAFAAKQADDGTTIIRQYATSPDDPWAVAHGLRAMGRGFTIAGGRRAVDYLLEGVLASLPANGRTALGFPIDVEVHPNMFLKTILEAGVPLEHAFTHEGRRRTLSEVVDGARALLRPSHVASVANALPWTLIAMTRTTSPRHARWTNAWGEPVDLDALVESALRLLEQASLPIAEAMRDGRPLTDQAPVHAFTCGGTHMLYGLLTAVHAGYVGRDRARRVQQQMDLLVWRLGADVDLIDRFYRAPGLAGDAVAAWFALDSKLKLLGHAQECLAFASRYNVVKFTAAQQTQRRAATATLRRIIGDLEQRDLREARALNRELYQQLVGDTCHARHGLTLA